MTFSGELRWAQRLPFFFIHSENVALKRPDDFMDLQMGFVE